MYIVKNKAMFCEMIRALLDKKAGDWVRGISRQKESALL